MVSLNSELYLIFKMQKYEVYKYKDKCLSYKSKEQPKQIEKIGDGGLLRVAHRKGSTQRAYCC